MSEQEKEKKEEEKEQREPVTFPDWKDDMRDMSA